MKMPIHGIIPINLWDFSWDISDFQTLIQMENTTANWVLGILILKILKVCAIQKNNLFQVSDTTYLSPFLL
jgi:hypothetical protein